MCMLKKRHIFECIALSLGHPQGFNVTCTHAESICESIIIGIFVVCIIESVGNTGISFNKSFPHPFL